LETVFVFFPGKKPIQKVKNQSVISSIFKKLSSNLEEWWMEKVLNRSVEEKQGKWNQGLKARIKRETGEIEIKCRTIIDPERKHIYYTIERLWEGEHWVEKVEDKASKNPTGETQ